MGANLYGMLLFSCSFNFFEMLLCLLAFKGLCNCNMVLLCIHLLLTTLGTPIGEERQNINQINNK